MTFYPDATDGYLYGNHSTYATAAAMGANTYAGTSTTKSVIGQIKSAYGYFCYEAFMNIDLAALVGAGATIDGAVLSLYGAEDATLDANPTWQVYTKDWGAALTTADAVPGGAGGANLDDLTKLASFNTATLGWNTAGYNDFTSIAALTTAIEAAVGGDGLLRLLIASDRLEAGTTPGTGTKYEDATFWVSGTAHPPKLVVIYHIGGSASAIPFDPPVLTAVTDATTQDVITLTVTDPATWDKTDPPFVTVQLMHPAGGRSLGRLGTSVRSLGLGTLPAGAYSWTAWNTYDGLFSAEATADTFTITAANFAPVCELAGIPPTIYGQPVSAWVCIDAYGDPQDAYVLQIASDVAFTSLEYDSGTVAGTTGRYVHTGLAAGLHYRRCKVRVRTSDWSDYEVDSFTIAAAIAQSSALELLQRFADGIERKIWLPISSPESTLRCNAGNEFTFTIDNFQPFVERAVFACHHFDETSGAVAHDIFGGHDLALTGAPAWTDGVLNLAGGDYGLTAATDIVMANDWTTYLAVKASGTSGELWSLSALASNSNYVGIRYWAAGYILIVKDANNSNALAVPATSWIILRLKNVSGTCTLARLDTGTSVTLAIGSPTGTARIGLGCFAGLTLGSIADAGLIAGHLFYTDDMTAAEDTRQLAAFRQTLIHRGVTVL
jgi:hypothetical protein